MLTLHVQRPEFNTQYVLCVCLCISAKKHMKIGKKKIPTIKCRTKYVLRKMMTHFLFTDDAGNGPEDEARLREWLSSALGAWAWQPVLVSSAPGRWRQDHHRFKFILTPQLQAAWDVRLSVF